MQPQSLPFVNMDQVFETVGDVVRNHLYHPLTGAPGEDVLAYLLHINREVRFELIRNRDGLTEQWDAIRDNTNVVDFILGVTADLRLRLDSSTISFGQVIIYLTNAYTQFQGRQSVIDTDLLERMPSPGTFSSLLTDNPWYVTLLLIKHSQCMRVAAYK